MYPSVAERDNNNHDTKADVQYFSEALYDIGYLKTEPAKFTNDIYAEVDLSLGKE